MTLHCESPWRTPPLYIVQSSRYPLKHATLGCWTKEACYRGSMPGMLNQRRFIVEPMEARAAHSDLAGTSMLHWPATASLTRSPGFWRASKRRRTRCCTERLVGGKEIYESFFCYWITINDDNSFPQLDQWFFVKSSYLCCVSPAGLFHPILPELRSTPAIELSREKSTGDEQYLKPLHVKQCHLTANLAHESRLQVEGNKAIDSLGCCTLLWHCWVLRSICVGSRVGPYYYAHSRVVRRGREG